MAPAPAFPTRSQTRLPPPTPLPEPYLRLTLGDPSSRTPFLHLTPALLRALPALLTSPTAATITITPPPPSPPTATHAHPAFTPYPCFWVDTPLANAAVSVEAAASSCVLGLGGVTARAFTLPGQRDAGAVAVALVSPETSAVLTDLTLSYLIIRPTVPALLPSLPALTPNIALHCAVVSITPADTTSRLTAAPPGPVTLDLLLPQRLDSLNDYADRALAAAAASGRVAVLVASAPDLCVLLALKQAALPVLCRVGDEPGVGGGADADADADVDALPDPRVHGIAAAAAFSQSIGLRGLVVAARALRGPGAGVRRAAARNCGLAVIADIGEDVAEGEDAEVDEGAAAAGGLKLDAGAGACPLGRAAAALQADGALCGGQGVVVATCAVFAPADFADGDGDAAAVQAGSPASHGSSMSSEGEVGAGRGMGCRVRSVTFSDPVVTPDVAARRPSSSNRL